MLDHRFHRLVLFDRFVRLFFPVDHAVVTLALLAPIAITLPVGLPLVNATLWGYEFMRPPVPVWQSAAVLVVWTAVEIQEKKCGTRPDHDASKAGCWGV